jgi:putative tryptophan/tyrosine transport system substrate-binding protein
MKRRALFPTAFGIVCALSSPIRAAGGLARIGWISAQKAGSVDPYVDALRAGLSELGYTEGRNFNFEFRYGNDAMDKVPALVEELVKLPVDIIVGQGAAAFEVRKLNVKVPMAYVISADPVIAGFAESLNRPLGNATGLTFMAVELNGKRMELLRQIMPDLQRVAVVGNPEHPGAQLERAFTEEKGREFKLKIDYFPTANEAELAGAFEKMSTDPPPAISVLADGFAVQNRQKIIDFAMSHRAPVISGWPVFVKSGALCTYGPRQADSYKRLAHYIDRILQGTSPSDLPIERPTTFNLAFNLKTASQLGLTIPPELLASADEVIE